MSAQIVDTRKGTPLAGATGEADTGTSPETSGSTGSSPAPSTALGGGIAFMVFIVSGFFFIVIGCAICFLHLN